MNENNPLHPQPEPRDAEKEINEPLPPPTEETSPKAEEGSAEAVSSAAQEEMPAENCDVASGETLREEIPRWYTVEDPAVTAKRQKRKERALLIYAATATVAFLLCFALLLGVAALYFARDLFEENGLSTETIAETACPATVLISAAKTSGNSYGTGFFLRPDGYIATNYHVIEGASELHVMLYGGTTLTAVEVGHDVVSDIAVLRVEGYGYPVLPLGDSSDLKVGERAVAIGNPAGPDAAWTVTQGIISSVKRTIGISDADWVATVSMIQTDAPVNHGNSGGPLCNARGEVIGIVTRKMADNEAIGFAIPINGAIEIINAIIEDGSAKNVSPSFVKVRPLLGISCSAVREGDTYTANGVTQTVPATGVMVREVTAGSAAYRLLYPYDVIVSIDGEEVTDLDSITDLMMTKKPGDTLRMEVIRNGLRMTVTVKLPNLK